jgi:hypothetical protein
LRARWQRQRRHECRPPRGSSLKCKSPDEKPGLSSFWSSIEAETCRRKTLIDDPFSARLRGQARLSQPASLRMPVEGLPTGCRKDRPRFHSACPFPFRLLIHASVSLRLAYGQSCRRTGSLVRSSVRWAGVPDFTFDARATLSRPISRCRTNRARSTSSLAAARNITRHLRAASQASGWDRGLHQQGCVRRRTEAGKPCFP